MIKSLTKEQEAKLPEFRDKWLKIGLATGPVNRKAAEEAIDLIYKVGGLEPPKIKIWLRSPLEGCIGAAILNQVWDQVRSQVKDQVRNQVWGQVRDQVGNQVENQVRNQVEDQVRNQVVGQVWDQVEDQVWEQVREQVLSQVWDQVGSQVGTQVWGQVVGQARNQVIDQVGTQVWGQVQGQVRNQVQDQVGDQVWDQVVGQVWDQVIGQVRNQVLNQVRRQVKDQVYKCGYGAHDANWLGFYDFFSSPDLLEKTTKPLKPMQDLAHNCGWWWPFEGAVILTEHPISITRDEEFRLHHDSKMALEYPDGWGIWAWHGIRVPKEIITEPEKITYDDILDEQNVEMRRIKLERYGLPRYLKNVGAREVARDERGVLLHTDRMNEWPGEDRDGARYVLVQDSSTDRQYALRVAPYVQTPSEGIAQTFGLTEKQYQPIQEA